MYKISLILSLTLMTSMLYGQDYNAMQKPDSDSDLKVDTGELRAWTFNVFYYFNNGYGDSSFDGLLKKFVEDYDENRDGKFSSLEFRRFQTGSKKLFSDATSFLTEKYDENRNKRLDKEEKETVRTEIKSMLTFSLKLREAANNGIDANEALEKKRALDDIYD